jgi:hypothetical protein
MAWGQGERGRISIATRLREGLKGKVFPLKGSAGEGEAY